MKYGVISIVGKPNVGKSTFLNSILNRDVVISSNKPQTTRNLIEVSYKDSECLINFLDTPGLHLPKNKLDHFLNSQVKQALKKSDITLFLFDASRDFDLEDEECLKVLKDFHVENIFLVINKIDLVEEAEVDRIEDFFHKNYEFKKTYKISAVNEEELGLFLESLKNEIKEYEGNIEDLSLLEKDVDDKFFVSELIREIIIKNFRQEIPYGVAIVINNFSYDKQKNMLSINYSIVVEKESQKPIIIGKGGSAMKKVNIELRNKLANYYDCKIFTTSEVKVRKNWRDNDTQIKELGYRK